MATIELWSWLVTAATIISICLTMRKIWWAPIFGLAHEGLWIIFAVLSGAWPLCIAAGCYTLVYAIAIPKWYRERETKRVK